MLWRTFLKSLWQNGKEKSDMLEVKFYDTVDDSLLKFAVIISLSNGKSLRKESKVVQTKKQY